MEVARATAAETVEGAGVMRKRGEGRGRGSEEEGRRRENYFLVARERRKEFSTHAKPVWFTLAVADISRKEKKREKRERKKLFRSHQVLHLGRSAGS
jgi:hypothetical protein